MDGFEHSLHAHSSRHKMVHASVSWGRRAHSAEGKWSAFPNSSVRCWRTFSIARQSRLQFASFPFQAFSEPSNQSPQLIFLVSSIFLSSRSPLFASFSSSASHNLSTSCELCTFRFLPVSNLPSHIRCASTCSLVPDFIFFLDARLSACCHSFFGLASARSLLFLHHSKLSSNFHSIDPATATSNEPPDLVSGPSCHGAPPQFSTVKCLTFWSVVSTASPPCPHHLPHQLFHAHHHHDDRRRTSRLRRCHVPTMCVSTSCHRTASCRQFLCTELLTQ